MNRQLASDAVPALVATGPGAPRTALLLAHKTAAIVMCSMRRPAAALTGRPGPVPLSLPRSLVSSPPQQCPPPPTPGRSAGRPAPHRPPSLQGAGAGRQRSSGPPVGARTEGTLKEGGGHVAGHAAGAPRRLQPPAAGHRGPGWWVVRWTCPCKQRWRSPGLSETDPLHMHTPRGCWVTGSITLQGVNAQWPADTACTCHQQQPESEGVGLLVHALAHQLLGCCGSGYCTG